MRFSLLTLLPFLLFLNFINAQSTTDDGYIGYSLSESGDPNSAVYDTVDTPANVSTTNPPPDVFLNATVHVGEINITVTELVAKINIEAQVLQLLQFNAGVDVSIDRVELLIENVNAHVLLEARLENLVLMISDVLDSLDLQPVLATLGQDVSQIVNTTVGGLTGGSSGLAARSLLIANNILYSVNNYHNDRHTNRVLAQNGSIIDEFLDNEGRLFGEQVVGFYATDMTFNGHNDTVTRDGKTVEDLQYVYTPFFGSSIVSAVFVDPGTTKVVATQVLSESGAGGSSTILGDL